jgi:hypothetical protein
MAASPILSNIRFAQIKSEYSKYLRTLESRDPKGAYKFREELRAKSGLSAQQLSRFEHSNLPLMTKNKKYVHDVIIEFFLSKRVSKKDQYFTSLNQIDSERWMVDYMREHVAEGLNGIWKGLMHFSDVLTEKNIKTRFIVEAKRAIFHVAARKFASDEEFPERAGQFFRNHSGGYRFISSIRDNSDTKLINVSGLYIEPSPYTSMNMFQEAFKNQSDNSTNRYRGICFSQGSSDALFHYFVSFFEGRVQLAIVKSEIRGGIWLEGIRLAYHGQYGPTAVPIVGVLIGKNFDCFRNRGVKLEAEYLADTTELRRENLLARLRTISKSQE